MEVPTLKGSVNLKAQLEVPTHPEILSTPKHAKTRANPAQTACPMSYAPAAILESDEKMETEIPPQPDNPCVWTNLAVTHVL
jgi:hypothetical protein